MALSNICSTKESCAGETNSARSCRRCLGRNKEDRQRAVANPEVGGVEGHCQGVTHVESLCSIDNLRCIVDSGPEVGAIESSADRLTTVGELPESLQNPTTLLVPSMPEVFAVQLTVTVLPSPAIQELSAVALAGKTSAGSRPQTGFPFETAMRVQPWFPPSRYRSLVLVSTAPPWSLKESSEMDLEVESYISHRSRHHHSTWHYPAMDPSQGVPPAAWPPGQCQFPT